jgi:hypothetical protein
MSVRPKGGSTLDINQLLADELRVFFGALA